jgi:hypothetical protein
VPASRLRLAATAVAILLVSGCGGEDRLTKGEYEQLVRGVYADVQTAFRATRVPPDRLGDRVEAAQGELREAADALDAVEPPAEVSRENDRLVAGMRAYATALDAVRDAAEEGDQAALEELGSSLGRSESVEEMAEAAEAMKFKGYDLGPIAEE